MTIPARTVAIYLKGPLRTRYTDSGRKFKSFQSLSRCSCRVPLYFFTTVKNERHLPFDREPRILREDVRYDGAVIADVVADDVHFCGCRDLKAERVTNQQVGESIEDVGRDERHGA